MDLKILGKNSKDKGHQLEILTATILDHLGYSNISTNVISSGGSEIDVSAQFLHRSPGGDIGTEVVCECKAYNQETDITSWLKFLGKIFTKEVSGPKVIGFFIALSGSNGNVRGHYKEIAKARQDIKLISGNELMILLREIYSTVDVGKLINNITKLTTRLVTDTQLCYYNKTLFWHVRFEDNLFAIFRSDGSYLSQSEIDSLVKMFSDAEGYRYLDMQAEAAAQERLLAIKKIVIDLLLDFNSPADINEIWKSYSTENYGDATIESIHEIESALRELASDNLVIGDRDKFILKVFTSDGAAEDKVKLFSILLNHFLLSRSISRAIFRDLIDAELLESLLLIQGGIDYTAEEKENCLRILKWSPSALLYALRQDDFLYNSSIFPSDIPPTIDKTRKEYYLQYLLKLLANDFRSSELKVHFYNNCEIVELETGLLYNIKSRKESIFNMQINERLGLFPLEGSGEQLVHLRMIPSASQPWDIHSNEVNIEDNT